jgi:hypothetical protein
MLQLRLWRFLHRLCPLLPFHSVWGTVYDFKLVFFLVSTDWKQSLKKSLNVLSSVCVSAHHHITCLHGMTYCLLIRVRGFLGMLCMFVHRRNTEARILFPFLEFGSGWQLSFCLCLDPLMSRIVTRQTSNDSHSLP